MSIEKSQNIFKQENQDSEKFRDDQAEKLVEFLRKVKARESVDKILSHENGFEFEEFKDFLVRINGILRDVPIQDRGTDGENVYISGFVDEVIVPNHNDKEDILRYAFEKSKELPKEDLKYVLPAVINAVHLFIDGNGRTSRVAHVLLKEISSEDLFSEEIKKVLGKYGRTSVDVNPGLISYELESLVSQQHGWVYNQDNPLGKISSIEAGLVTLEMKDVDTSNPSYETANKFFSLYANDSRYVLSAIYMVIGDKGIENVTGNYNGLKRVSPKKMFEQLDQNQWNEMINTFYQLKKEEAKMLVDIFMDPEKYKFPADSKENLKEMFLNKILEKSDNTEV